MDRRDFIKAGIYSLSTVALGSTFAFGRQKEEYDKHKHRHKQEHNIGYFDLTIESATVEMTDLSQVFMRLYGTPTLGPSFPGPVIEVEEGYVCVITVTNKLAEPHGFQILGTGVSTGPINPGQTKTVNFPATFSGTYLYTDPVNPVVNRVLGLHGALVVVPATISTIPYSNPTPSVRQLFNDLGTTTTYPGEPWTSDPAADRSRIWLFSTIDPVFNSLAAQGRTINPAQLSANFLPRYFTINGKSGFFSSEDETTALTGNVGQPHLVRMINAGLATHSPHLHANHYFVVAVNGTVQGNVFLVDTFRLRPLDRIDILVPFERPPDIPVHPNNPNRLLRIDAAQELTLSFGDVPQSPLQYPMHCHMEMSQTAAGGNYPLGMTTHFTFTGDVDGVPFPV